MAGTREVSVFLPEESSCQRRRRKYDVKRMHAKMPTVRARAAARFTPVKRKRAASRRGQTGRATAGLKSPGTYHWPRWKWRMAASPYQPSSVYLAQSIQGEWLGKSALRWTPWRARKRVATRRRTASATLRMRGGMGCGWFMG